MLSTQAPNRYARCIWQATWHCSSSQYWTNYSVHPLKATTQSSLHRSLQTCEDEIPWPSKGMLWSNFFGQFLQISISHQILYWFRSSSQRNGVSPSLIRQTMRRVVLMVPSFPQVFMPNTFPVMVPWLLGRKEWLLELTNYNEC